MPPRHETGVRSFEVVLELEASAREDPATDSLYVYREFTEVDALTNLKRVAARRANQRFEEIAPSGQASALVVLLSLTGCNPDTKCSRRP